MCRVLKISESGYYRWLKNKSLQPPRELLTVKIKAIISEHPDNSNYGIERIKTACCRKELRLAAVRYIVQCLRADCFTKDADRMG